MATRIDIERHYNDNNAVLLRILDPQYRSYSTGHWAGARTMTEAQEAKFAYIADQIDLGSRRRVLEVGSGWGSFANYCARNFPHVELVGLTLSSTQEDFVREQAWPNFRCVLSDWRDFSCDEPFDAVVAIESLEHFASMEDRRQNAHVDVYRRFFAKCADLSRRDAPLYVQSSVVRSGPDDVQGFSDARFILDRIFPGSALATISSIQLASHGLYEFEELVLRGQDCIRTLEWWKDALSTRREEIERDVSPEAFLVFERYFDASMRRFQKGHVDLLELTLTKQRIL